MTAAKTLRYCGALVEKSLQESRYVDIVKRKRTERCKVVYRCRFSSSYIYLHAQKDTTENNFSFTQRENYSDQQKQDRRGLLSRVLASLHPFLQRLSLKLVPPTDDDVFYEDTHNDEPWKCSFGTHETDGVWMNYSDRVGTLMAFTVWILMGYSGLTVLLLAQNNHIPLVVASLYCTIVALALSSHAKTTFTDPGAVPSSAVPIRTQGIPFHNLCSLCQSYKPTRAHHCRVCNRCISNMDHRK